MKSRINKMLKALDLEIAGGGGSGYFYFVRLSTNEAIEMEPVMVSAMSHLTVDEWKKEAIWALKHEQDQRFH